MFNFDILLTNFNRTISCLIYLQQLQVTANPDGKDLPTCKVLLLAASIAIMQRNNTTRILNRDNYLRTKRLQWMLFSITPLSLLHNTGGRQTPDGDETDHTEQHRHAENSRLAVFRKTKWLDGNHTIKKPWVWLSNRTLTKAIYIGL